MGFSVTVSNVILVVASVSVFGQIATAGLELRAEVSDARALRLEAEEIALRGALGEARYSYDPVASVLTIRIKNTGEVALDPAEVGFVLDGALVESGVSSTVEGASASEAWLPGEWAAFTIAGQDGVPARILATGEAGVANFTRVPAGPLAYVRVAPATVDVAAGATQAFDARGYDVNWHRVTGLTFTWSTNAGSVAAVDADSATLTAQTTAQSGRTVTATSGGVSGSATVNVVAGPVASVAVSPTPADVGTSAARTFSAVAYDAYGNVVTSATFVWSATRGTITSGGVYTAPATTGADTVTAASGAIQGTASVTVVAYTYASTTTTDLAGGTIANAPALAQDGGGDVATLAESTTPTPVTVPSAANDRTFASSPIAGWTLTPVLGTFTLAQLATDGQPAGAMQVAKTNVNEGTARVEHSWTQAGSDSVVGATFDMAYKFTSNSHADRYVEAWLVKPDGSSVQIGARKTDAGNAWRTFGATSLAGSDLSAGGTYTLRFVVGLRGNGDELRIDNVVLSFTQQTAYRFGKQLDVPGLPALGSHTLEVRYRIATGTEGLELWTEGPSASWTQRTTLASATFATFTRTLTAAETASGAVALRLIDALQSGDAAQGQWEVDYVRVRSV